MPFSPQPRTSGLVVVTLLLACATARAQAPPRPPSGAPAAELRLREPGPDASVRDRQAYWSVAPLPPVETPPGLERRHPLSDFQRRQKRAQKPMGVVGLPELGGNPDWGFVVGAVAAATWYGEPEDPYYDYSPYEQRLVVEGHVALKRKPNVLGRQSYRVRYSAPYIANSLFSLVAEGAFLMDANSQYFGTGTSTMGSLSEIAPAPLQGTSFDTYRSYLNTLRQVEGGQTYAVYNNYLLQEPRLNLTARVDLLGGILVPTVGIKIARVFVERYGGDLVRGVDGTGISEPTKLDEDCDAGIARHCEGTWDNTLKLALTLDLRDLPIDPDQGVLVDAAFEAGPEAFGSPGYWRTTQTLSAYFSPIQTFSDIDNKWSQLVLAWRLLYSVTGGDAPFYGINRLTFYDRTLQGLGGIHSLRGFRLNRFVGPVMAASNLELRYDMFFSETDRSTFNLKLVGFYDTGRVWDDVRDTSLRGYRHDGGFGIYLQWNQTNVVRTDIGFGDEGASGGVTFGMLF